MIPLRLLWTSLPPQNHCIISKKFPATMMTGGLSDPKPATPEIQHLVDQVKPQLESRENKTYGIFTAILYRSQVVAGVNYFVKVQNGENDYVHLRIFEALPHENQGPRLTGYQTGKTRDDPLDYF